MSRHGDRRRPDWWPDEVEWLAPCEVAACGRFTNLRVVVNGTARPRCDRHRHGTERTLPVAPPGNGVRRSERLAA